MHVATAKRSEMPANTADLHRDIPGQSSTTSTMIPRPISLRFSVQLAHGSPTGLISGFSSVKELYSRISECYDISTDEILFCTLNTHKLDMTNLLGGQIALNDFIFVHLKGQKKEVEILKDDPALGLTITDNGNGYAFIKRIKPGSVADKLSSCIHVGDHIEKLDGVSLVGKRHYEVAKALRELPVASSFVLRLIEPLKAGFANIGPRSSGRTNKPSYGSGRQTLRFKSHGPAIIEDAPDDAMIERINGVLDTYMGISDKELALSIWEIGKNVKGPVDFTEAIKTSDLKDFQIPEDVTFDIWGVISDFKAGRLCFTNTTEKL